MLATPDGTTFEGQSQSSDRPHAVQIVLNRAGQRANGAVLYSTLEPVECAGTIVSAGVAAVFIAMPNPDPRQRGRGIRKLLDAGISVSVGVGHRDVRDQLESRRPPVGTDS